MIDWLGEQCSSELLAEKWLLAPRLAIAVQWKDRLNLSGQGTVNLHPRTLRTAVTSLVSSRLAEQKLQLASRITVRMIVRNVLLALLDTGQLRYFQEIQSIDGLSKLVARSIGDLRLASLGPEALDVDAFQSDAKAADLRLIFRAYCEALQERCLVDYASCIQQAVHGIKDGSVELPNDLLVLMPQSWRVAPAESDLLRTLSEAATIKYPDHVDPLENTWNPQTTLGNANVEFFSGVGEVNEVRGVFQRILGRPGGAEKLDDVEILHTDSDQYEPLILEQMAGWLAEIDGDGIVDVETLPVTFAGGIACIYSRPGRALRGWLRWIRHEFVQTRAVQLIREGLLMRPENAASIGFSRLAGALRQVPIGFRRDRYLSNIDDAIRAAERSLHEYRQQGEAEAGEASGERPKRDFGLAALRAVLAMVQPMVECVPDADDAASDVLNKAKQFLLRCARAENKLDRIARTRLLDDIDGMLSTLEITSGSELDVIQWLEDLPIESHVLATGPQPGRVHVASLADGGQSGRNHVFIVGLDDERYPKRIPTDCVLLDSERQKLSKDLPTSGDISADLNRAMDRVLDRVVAQPNHRICLSYSARNLADDRMRFPSAAMVDFFRVTTGNDQADVNDLESAIGAPVSFASADFDDNLVPTDRNLTSLLIESSSGSRQQWLEENYPYFAQQRIACEAAAEPSFGPFDGYVPGAGEEMDPQAAERISASRLETYGACPRRFFFRHGLRISPPDEWIVDRERWLDPLQYGNLVHSLLEQFLAELTQQDLVPIVERDRARLLELLDEKIDSLKTVVPIPNEDAYRRTREWLEETCDIFLANEQEYCRQQNARPWVLEASLGLDGDGNTELDCREPIALTMTDGRVIRVGGRLDRVDKLMTGGSERYAIWDYKSGSSYGFSQEDPFGHGRKLQPLLYFGMLRHRIAAMGGQADSVESFGYFFPSPKTDGLRLSWTRGELRSGDQLLGDICELIAGGVFLATTDKSDCRFCDYQSVCGDAESVAELSRWKSAQSCNQILGPWRQLREIDLDGEAS